MKHLKRITMLVTAVFIAASFAGCGTGEADVSRDAATEASGETNETEQMIIPEVSEQETKSAFESGEIFTNGEIVLEHTGNTAEYYLKDPGYQMVEGGEITIESDFPVYCEDGYKIGYIKAGTAINVTEKSAESAWGRFINPVEGTEFEYLY